VQLAFAWRVVGNLPDLEAFFAGEQRSNGHAALPGLHNDISHWSRFESVSTSMASCCAFAIMARA